MHISKMEETNDYFTAFVKKDPFGTITDESVQIYENGNAYLHSGMYTFDLGQGSARAPVEARFSYMWRLEDSAWKISHHHSSVRPAGHGGSKPAGGQASVSIYSAGSQPKNPAGIDVARVRSVCTRHAVCCESLGLFHLVSVCNDEGVTHLILRAVGTLLTHEVARRPTSGRGTTRCRPRTPRPSPDCTRQGISPSSRPSRRCTSAKWRTRMITLRRL
jgi:hypothetical protein